MDKEWQDQEDEAYEGVEEYWDDTSGHVLDPRLVKEAREEEMVEFRKHGVCAKVPIQDCIHETGRKPIGCK